MSYCYFTKEYALKLIERMLEQTGNKLVIIKPENLDGPLEFVQNDMYYPNIEDKVAYLMYSFNSNHCFIDGNKRASVVIASFLLEINGYDFVVDSFIKRIENFAIYIADGKVDKVFLTEIIRSLIYEDDFSEELKIKIVNKIFN